MLLIAEHEAFLYARLVKEFLVVYRSTALPESDQWLKPVRALLDTYPHELVGEAVVKDELMMFGEGILSVYVLEDM